MRLFISVTLGLFISVLLILPAQAIDNDHDGVEDSNDLCPNTKQIKKLPANFKYRAAVNSQRLHPGNQAYPVNNNGCEFDDDGDGVVNSQDYCPNNTPLALSMGISANGCPRQSDYDGTPDYRDKCPHTPRYVKTDRHGCEIKT